jgi:hypothetical protein
MPNTNRQTHHRKQAPASKPVEAPSDKKAHTAGVGILLILLTNYQAEIKQVFSAIMKALT